MSRVAVALPASQASRADAALPFSLACLAVVLVARPVIDALWESTLTKYLYMFALFGTAYLAYAGRALTAFERTAAGPVSPVRSALWVAMAAYGAFLVTLAAAEGGYIETIFKIVSPFLLYLVVAPNLAGGFSLAIAISSCIVIFGNFALLAFDYGWTDWGGVRTFKGYYYFKTDLAFGLGTALLALAVHLRFRMNWLLGAALLAGAVQVVLSNARMNYLIYLLVVVMILVQGGWSWRRLLGQAGMLGALALAAAALYDPQRLLSPFDLSNLGRFTQGRDEIWGVLVGEGLASYSAADWLFGRGLFADVMLYAEYGDAQSLHNAHNEYLWLLVTQGIVGSVLYLVLWALLIADVRHGMARGVARFWIAMPLLALALQGMTAGVSVVASKTWPVIFVLLAIKAQSMRRLADPARARP